MGTIFFPTFSVLPQHSSCSNRVPLETWMRHPYPMCYKKHAGQVFPSLPSSLLIVRDDNSITREIMNDKLLIPLKQIIQVLTQMGHLKWQSRAMELIFYSCKSGLISGWSCRDAGSSPSASLLHLLNILQWIHSPTVVIAPVFLPWLNTFCGASKLTCKPPWHRLCQWHHSAASEPHQDLGFVSRVACAAFQK